MRLIDADELIKDRVKNDPVRIAVQCAPTAFYKEKVIEELEKLRMGYFLTIANTGDEKLDCAYEHVGNALDNVLEIVEKGGIE